VTGPEAKMAALAKSAKARDTGMIMISQSITSDILKFAACHAENATSALLETPSKISPAKPAGIFLFRGLVNV